MHQSKALRVRFGMANEWYFLIVIILCNEPLIKANENFEKNSLSFKSTWYIKYHHRMLDTVWWFVPCQWRTLQIWIMVSGVHWYMIYMCGIRLGCLFLYSKMIHSGTLLNGRPHRIFPGWTAFRRNCRVNSVRKDTFRNVRNTWLIHRLIENVMKIWTAWIALKWLVEMKCGLL